MDNNKVLEMRNIHKSFPGVRALKGVDFHLNKGEIHALMGENGAGKSTLIKVLTGVYSKDEGQIFIDGKDKAGKLHENQGRQSRFLHTEHVPVIKAAFRPMSSVVACTVWIAQCANP